MKKIFQNEHVSCVVNITPERILFIQGEVENPKKYTRMHVMAAHPIQQMTSYSGSGLPWACPNMAMENTPNYFEIPSAGKFMTQFSYPNSYYTNDGLQEIPPSLFFVLTPFEGDPVITQFTLKEESPLQLRTLTHRTGRALGPEFYHSKDADFEIIPSSAEKMMMAYKDYKLARDRA